MADPIADLFRTISNAVAALGSDADERQLKQMAESCRGLERALQTVEKTLQTPLHGPPSQPNPQPPPPVHGPPSQPPVYGPPSQWSGGAASGFQDVKREQLSPEERHALRENLKVVAEVLDAAADASHQTKRALEELIKSIMMALATGVAISLTAGALGAYVAWAARADIAAKGAVSTATIITRLASFLKNLGVTLRNLMVTGGRSKVAKAWTLNGSETLGFGKTSLAAFSNYGKVFGMSWAGGYVTAGLSRMTNGQSFVSPFGLGYAQLTNAAGIAAALPFGTQWWAKAHAANPVRMNFAAGVSAGALPSPINDLIQGGKSPSEMARNVALFGSVSGGFNAGMGVGMGKVGITDPKLVMGVGSFFGLLPGTALRAVVPLAPTQEPLQIPENPLKQTGPGKP
ncbi:hypothetical protein [Streptosporangium sp. NBC_01469]|uniref:hypothetical protein n=1 Tax=Streptosporangium sp. NBC_01469 TaxID=2903898 RepID=UPI002E297050|nr:hypothetical protein [Streptosporangium sp. NBC_01469]